MLEPGIRSGELPPFHRIGAYRFEELCRDLLGTEPDIAACDIYGKPGQTQHGIDLLAHRSNGDGIEVGQCKCYEDFPPRKIRAVSDEFFEHWDMWSKSDVKRFVLFVASDLKTRQRQDEILAQGKRFEQLDIVYEAWSAATILNKLRPRPGIVASHLIPREYWVPVICGTSLPVSGFGGELLDTVHIALKSQIALLAMRLSDDKGERIEHLREAWREGRREETLRGIAALKEDPVVWPLLHIETQARLLRFEANVVLQTTGDVLRAKELADEAYALVSSDGESSLRALIAYVEFGPEAALPILAEQQDLDSRNLKAAFLLEMGCVDEGNALLDYEAAGFEPNAETFRLRALLRLGEREIDLAQLEIQKAAELAPQWESVRYTLAVVNYFSALSPAALPNVLVPWPEPVEWSLVKRDDESLQRLRAAGKTFRDMSKEGTREDEQHRRLQAWRLACLANDPEQQEAAIQHCQIMLTADATDFRALCWVVARNFGLELENSEAALETLVADGSATIPHVLALAGCYVTSRKIDLAKRLLDSQRSLFEEAQMLPLWNLWYVQLLIASDETDAASAALDQVPAGEELRLARLVTLIAQSRSSGDWQTTFEFLDTSYAETHNPRFLLDGCELAAQIERWEYTADRAEQLVDGLQTEEALRLAAYATYNTRRYEVCLELLDRYIKLCSRQMLPRDLRRVRALCQQALGAFPSAVAELEDLANETSETENLLALALLYSEIGDLRGLTVVGRKLSVHPDLGAAEALQLAQLIRLEDLSLAKVLWFRAGDDLPDCLVGQALSLGYELGLDEEASHAFSPRMLELARQEQGGVFLKRIEDLSEMFAQSRERHAELEQLYREGKVPIHLIAEQLRLPLVNLYRSQLSENEKTLNLLGSPPLLARHGARPLLLGFPAQVPEWRLHLDTTSLLLAAHLDILDAVERVFAPLRIPAELIGALVSMRYRLRHPQPSRLETYQKIVQLARKGTFQTVNYDGSPFVPDTPDLVEDLGESWQYLFEHARASEGYLVDFLPLKKLGTSQVLPNLPDAVTERVVNCRSIVEALHRCGPLASRDYARALEKLGNEDPKPPIWVIPEPGAPLYFYANTPELLVGAELFRDVCGRFEVYIEQRELDLALAALEAHQQTQKVDNWLENLIARLRHGLETNTYQTLPQFEDREHREETGMIGNPDILCLLSLFAFDAQHGDVVWIDDRYTNGFARRGAVPIVDINQVLKALVTSGELHRDDYYGKLDRLRAANVRFIPVQADEILYDLQQARVGDGVLVETRQLEHLRRYVAACLVQGSILQQPYASENTQNPQGEVPFLLALHRTVAEALFELWCLDMADDVRLAQAEWILTKLHMDYLGLRTLGSLPSVDQSSQHYIYAMSLTNLLLQAIAFMPDSEDAHSPRKQYFDWLTRRVLNKRFDVDPQLVVIVTVNLKSFVQSYTERHSNRQVVAGLLQPFYEDLPEAIREELQLDTEFMASIGITVETEFSLDDLYFSSMHFWQAATAAVNGREAVITPKGMTESITFKPVNTGRDDGSFCFQHPTHGNTVIIKGDEFQLLRDSPTEREAALLQNRHWFDCTERGFRQAVASIASTSDPQRRFEELETWRSASARVYYEALHRDLSEHKGFQFAELIPPSTEGLLRHFRLTSHTEPERASGDALTTAAQTIIDEESLPAAIDRFSGLPTPLPRPVVDAIAALSAQDKRTLFKKLLGIAGSPISKFHLVSLLLRYDDEVPAFRRLAQRIALSLFGDGGRAYIEAYLAVLQWTYAAFYRWPQTQGWPSHIQLAMVWAHAHRLFSTFLSVSADLEWMRDAFTGVAQTRMAVEVFERDDDLWFDIAHPRHVSRITLLFDGLCYAFGERASEFEQVGSFLAAESFSESEGGLLPVLPLVRDSTRANNTLSTFLDGNSRRDLPLWLARSEYGTSSDTSLDDWIARTVNTLAESPDEYPVWLVLLAVLGDFPPEADLALQLQALFSKIDYVALFRKNARLGYIALQTASMQCHHLHDEELRQHLRAQVLEIARNLANLETTDGTANGTESLRGIHGLLIEIALNIASAVDAQLDTDTAEEFSRLLLQLADAWRALIPFCKPLVQILIEELPVRQLDKLWVVLAWLRAN